MAEKFAMIAAEKKDWYRPSDMTAKQTEWRARNYFSLNGLTELISGNQKDYFIILSHLKERIDHGG